VPFDGPWVDLYAEKPRLLVEIELDDAFPIIVIARLGQCSMADAEYDTGGVCDS
jgi:hypothetical protein